MLLSGVLLDMIYFKKLTWTTYNFLDVNFIKFNILEKFLNFH